MSNPLSKTRVSFFLPFSLLLSIVTQPNEVGFPSTYGSQYIAASYVKYVEASGARVVPIFFDGDESYLDEMFRSVNAVLFPGGGQILDGSQLLKTTQFFVSRAAQAYESGDYFPIFGHCQGFELLLMAVTGLMEEQVLTNDPSFAAENVSLPLMFTPNAFPSRWFADMPLAIRATLSGTNATLNNHMWSCPPDLFATLQKNTPLNTFVPLATSVSPQGKTFVAAFESTTYPLYAMQFHAEKSVFEWPNEQIDHSTEAVAAMSWFLRFLGSEARKSFHSFSSKETEAANLIYNWSPDYSIGYCSFEQVYYFK